MIDHITIGKEDYREYWHKFVKQIKTEFGFIKKIECFSGRKSRKFIVYFNKENANEQR